MTENTDMALVIIVCIVISLACFAWGYSYQKLNYEAGYKAAIEELTVVVKEEICR